MTPKRSLSMPYRAVHPDGARGCAMVAPAESFSQRAEISAAESPRATLAVVARIDVLVAALDGLAVSPHIGA